MIISASRRTDIPAFYAPWLLNRLRAGQVLVRNPFHFARVARVSLDPAVVDCLVFWTKNPAPLVPHLAEIEQLGHRYYLQFTLTGCDRELEPRVPAREEGVATFRRLAERIGPERVLWRFDPIVLTCSQGPEEVLARFAWLAERLHPFTRRCTLSFVSLYAKCRRNLAGMDLEPEEIGERVGLIQRMGAVAGRYGLALHSCCDPLLRDACGLDQARCIDDRLAAALAGQPLRLARDRGQRPGCGCAASIDIGAYDTCPHGCRYCYANASARIVARNQALHDPHAPLLGPPLTGRELISDRTAASCRTPQPTLF